MTTRAPRLAVEQQHRDFDRSVLRRAAGAAREMEEAARWIERNAGRNAAGSLARVAERATEALRVSAARAAREVVAVRAAVVEDGAAAAQRALWDIVRAEVAEVPVAEVAGAIAFDLEREVLAARVRLAVASLPAGTPTSAAAGEAARALRAGAWQVERRARDVLTDAYARGQGEVIRFAIREDPRIMKRWTEMVDDATGRPLDNRVGIDSVVLHGQVASPDGVFTMPADPRAPTRMIGQSWSGPPNRPNDRAVLLPWRPGCGLPAWRLVSGARVQLR